MSIEEAIAVIESALPEPEQGLPQKIFDFFGRNVPLPNVDLLVQDTGGRTLFTWREDERYGPGWHLPGGVIRFKETALHRVHEVAREELGTTVSCQDEPLTIGEFIVGHRTRGHSISLLYRCSLAGELDPRLKAGDPPQSGQWKWHKGCPPNIIPEQKVFRPYFL